MNTHYNSELIPDFLTLFLRSFFQQGLQRYNYIDICYDVLHQGNNICTPTIEGTILPGITRKTIIEVAKGKATR
jgi:hypothetical protein